MAQLGDTVIYRNKDGVDIPAMITELVDPDLAYLARFPPPRASGDPTTVSYPIARAEGDKDPRIEYRGDDWNETWRERDDPGA